MRQRRRGQCGKNRDGMNKALVEDAEHDVNRGERGENQQAFIGERALKEAAVLEIHTVRWPAYSDPLDLFNSRDCASSARGARLNDTVTAGNWLDD